MNVENLKKLALFLWDLPEEDARLRFEMGDFNDRHSGPLELVKDEHMCETASCAIGWGPSAGILPTDADKHWISYSNNHFVQSSTMEWYWMFSSEWKDHDNSPRGAAKRILWLLEKGKVPEEYYPSVIKIKYTLGEEGYYENYDSNGFRARKHSVGLYKDWIPDAIQSRDSLRVPVLDQNQPPEGGDQNQPSFSDPV